MGKPIVEELNIRERIEKLFSNSGSGSAADQGSVRLQQATDQLSAALSTYLPIEFELGVPTIQALSADGADGSKTDQIVLQFERSVTDSKFRLFLSEDFVGFLVRASFGNSSTSGDIEFDCRASEFCNFFISLVGLKIMRNVISFVSDTRPQSISFEQIIDDSSENEPGESLQSGLLSTWPLIMNETQFEVGVYIPETEFGQLSGPAEEESDEKPDETNDLVWLNRMQSSLSVAEVQLHAMMSRPDVPLKDISDLKVGDVFEIAEVKAASILLECEGEPLYSCEVGQKDGRFAVHLIDEVGVWNGLLDQAASQTGNSGDFTSSDEW